MRGRLRILEVTMRSRLSHETVYESLTTSCVCMRNVLEAGMVVEGVKDICVSRLRYRLATQDVPIGPLGGQKRHFQPG